MLHEGKVSFVSTQVEQTVQKIKDFYNKFSVSRKLYKVYGPQVKLPRDHLVNNKERSDCKK